MGSGRDKRKAAKERKEGPAVGKGQDKTERKTQKNEVRGRCISKCQGRGSNGRGERKVGNSNRIVA